jgi:hypothetical protein
MLYSALTEIELTDYSALYVEGGDSDLFDRISASMPIYPTKPMRRRFVNKLAEADK